MIGDPTNLSLRTHGHATLRIQDFLLALLLWIGGYFGTRTQSPDCKTGVLSFELKTQKNALPNCIVRTYRVESKGLEPSIPCVQGRCISQFCHDPKFMHCRTDKYTLSALERIFVRVVGVEPTDFRV